MSETEVLKAISIVGFWLVVIVICPMPLYSRFFNAAASIVPVGGGDASHGQSPETIAMALKLAKRTARHRALLAERVCSLSNSLSGGLFLALGLIHLLPEAAEAFEGLYDAETVEKYRPAFASAFCSYTLLLIIQRVVFSEHGHSHGGGDHDHHDHHHHLDEDEDTAQREVDAQAQAAVTEGENLAELLKRRDDGAPPSGTRSAARSSGYGTSIKGASDVAAQPLLIHQRDNNDEQHHPRRSTHPSFVGSRRQSIVLGDADGSIAHARSSIRESSRRSDVLVRIVLQHAAPDELPTDATAEGGAQLYDQGAAVATVAPIPITTTRVVTSIVLMLAFSLHGLAEGMALGVQRDADSVVLMILAVALHKWAEALSIGISFQKSGLPRRHCMVYIIAFAFSSPLGIGIGWASEALLPEVMSAYLMAFSTGTFLYLGASDAIVEEFAQGRGRNWIRLVFYMIGAVTVFLISAFLDHDHDDEGSGGGE